MRIDLYARCWNEQDLLPFFFLHYDDLVQRYIVYDDGSTDDSLELLRRHPKVELRSMPYSNPDSRIASALALQEECWKESRGVADWVIVTDIDEHLYHPRLKDYLAKCLGRGVTIVPALGFQMVSETLPAPTAPLTQSLTKGAPHSPYNKLNIFAPDAIERVNWVPGRHKASPTGRLLAPAQDRLLLLHYHCLGFERVKTRYAGMLKRQRQLDHANRWGHQYGWTEDRLRAAWDGFKSRLVDVRSWHDAPRANANEHWWADYRRGVQPSRSELSSL